MSLFVRISGELPIYEKCFFRNAVALIAITVFMAIRREKFIPKKEAIPQIFGRSVFGLIGIYCNFLAISNLNISDAAILNKMSPFFAMIFSAIFLKERITPRDIVILLIAFVGALFVVKPGFEATNIYSYIGLIGGISVGGAYTCLRCVGLKGESGTKIVFWFSLFSTVVFTPLFIIFYEPMESVQLLYLCLAGVSAACAQFCVTAAYTHAPSKEISVFDYSQVIFTAIWGLIFLNQIPDYLSIIGYVIIILVAVYKWRKNLKEKLNTAVSKN